MPLLKRLDEKNTQAPSQRHGTTWDSTGIANATVTLATLVGDVLTTTKIDSTGNYEFKAVSPGNYDLTATKRGYWLDSGPVTKCWRTYNR